MSYVQIKGELHAFRQRRNLWGVADVRVHGEGDVTAVGEWPGVSEGDTVVLGGFWSSHDVWGRQFRVRSVEVTAPADASGVIAWLASRIPYLGQHRASLLVERFGVEGLWSRIESMDPELLTVNGINAARLKEIGAAYARWKGERDRGVKLRQWGLTQWQIARAVEVWGDQVEAVLSEDPYRLCREVPGFGFKKADAIARRMGLALDSPARIQAAVAHMVDEATMGGGHIYLPRHALTRATAKLCGLRDWLIEEQLEALCTDGVLLRREERIYTPRLDVAEASVAEAVTERLAHGEAA